MNKMFTIIKREYLSHVRSKFFVIMTVLGPLLMIGLTFLPVLLMRLDTGNATRIAVVDESGRIYERLRASLTDEAIVSEEDERENADREAAGRDRRMSRSAAFDVIPVDTAGRSLAEVQQDLDARIRNNELDAYLIVPRDVTQGGEARYYARNTGDVVGIGQVRRRLNNAVIAERMKDRQLDEAEVRRLQTPVAMNTDKITERGTERDTGGGFILAYAVGMLIYITVIVYGQVVLASVVEEKTTRIPEVLFSSVRAFPLMLGKLIGVSLVALTQYAVWILSFSLVTIYGASTMRARGGNFQIPSISPSLIVYLFLFFLLGYFLYATIYALIGAMVTTTQEGGQVSMPVLFLLIIGFFLSFTVIRSPSSTFSFWASMIPFFAPITMLVRIVTETPPFWQILLSLVIGFGTVIGLVWLAARVYRTGMLMYGKRATIPEVWRWVRQT